MDENKNGLPNENEAASLENANAPKSFEQYSPMQQERIMTRIHTIGSKQDMRRFEASLKDNETGRVETL
jgi:hypothetical protein